MNEELLQTIRCPYCEELITGDPLYIMGHGLVCRKQWEARLESIKQENKDNDKDRTSN